MKFQYHLITDHTLYRQPLHEVAYLSELNGLEYFHLREKELSKRDLMEIGRHIRPVLEDTKYIVNGHLDVALICKADGVHLQKGNIPVNVVRKKFPDLIIGYSAHSLQELQDAESAGADYAFISPVFSSLSKRQTQTPLGIQKLKEWISKVRIPVFALGGVSADKLQEIADSGCCGAAGISMFMHDGKFNPTSVAIR